MRHGVLLWLAIGILVGAAGYGRAQDRVGEGSAVAAALDKWLFAGEEEFYRVGDRVLRYPENVDLPVVFSSFLAPDPLSTASALDQAESLQALLHQIGPALTNVGLLPMKVRGLEEEAETPRGVVRVFLAPPSLRLLPAGPLAGYEAVVEAAEAIRCVTFQSVPYAERHPTAEDRRWRLVGATIRIDATLPLPRFEDCLFRSLLIALGLHHSERLAFDPAPLTPEERAEALAVLSLVYHPEVESGMTREQFLAVLRAEGLLAE